MCDDCQTYAHFLGRAHVLLDAHGGTDLSYATQARIAISQGHEQLRAVRLRDGGMLRVYTACCHTPLAHVPFAKLAFVGIPHLALRFDPSTGTRDEVLGPLVYKLVARYSRGEPPHGAHLGTPLHLTLRGLWRMLWNTARGEQAPSPFHDSATGAPLMATTILSAEECERLRANVPSPAARATTGRFARSCS
jgi:hypothetical protein